MIQPMKPQPQVSRSERFETREEQIFRHTAEAHRHVTNALGVVYKLAAEAMSDPNARIDALAHDSHARILRESLANLESVSKWYDPEEEHNQTESER